MQSLINQIRNLALPAVALFAMTSCVYDEEPVDLPEPEAVSLLNIDLQLPGMRAGTDSETHEGYEAGEGYENYIDVANKNYAIYFFNKDNKYIARFDPLFGSMNGVDGEATQYQVVGKVPDEIKDLTEFKIVVLANWPNYSGLTPGVTTINDLCVGQFTQFSWRAGSMPDGKDSLIPFYGVHYYSGVTFGRGRTELSEPVTLLRAVAKVEVVVDIDNVSLVSAGLKGFNTKGYCAPKNITHQDQYDHNGVWAEDYVQDPYIVNGLNDNEETNNAAQYDNICPMKLKYKRDAMHKETWVAYVPEYRNLITQGNPKDKLSKIQLKLDIGDKIHEVFFADYKDGVIVPDSYFNICRNNLYRFTISLKNGGLAIQVKWDNTYDNNFVI